jgi:hypothetical protein
MAKQSLRRSLQRGSYGKVSSTKISKHTASKNIRRKNRFGNEPSADTIAKRERRQRKIDSPFWELVGNQWVNLKKVNIVHD